ncbi:MAG: leucyl/phenylalanyl-tRNA--protein transferase [Deltaproteobacteria bacterium]|nr:leucyl/phenylalanyl-tRNA--protein transferase [Deltaproteobacteria bacterium]
MPVYQIPKEIIFPRPDLAEPSGLLAVGGDLSVERLLTAYSLGVFPWYSGDDPILWWSPDPRLMLEPGNLKISRSLQRVLNKKVFSITFDRDFEAVIRSCALTKRKQEDGTWIVDEMISAYIRLHETGFAHSMECWYEDELAGGLYGVSIGSAFFGESMFTERTDASKVALVHLVAALTTWKFDLIDCQVPSDHLLRMGAQEMERTEFLQRLKKAISRPTRRGQWKMPENIDEKIQELGR